jgi:putative transposase
MSVEPLSGGLVDNGTEFIANKRQLCLAELKIKPIYIIPATPWGSGFVELFHSSFRDECLNRERRWPPIKARVVIEDYRQDYNVKRSHS